MDIYVYNIGMAMGVTDFINPRDLGKPVHEVSVTNCDHFNLVYQVPRFVDHE